MTFRFGPFLWFGLPGRLLILKEFRYATSTHPIPSSIAQSLCGYAMHKSGRPQGGREESKYF